jgi:DNA mismatch repair protein MutS2
VLEVARQHVARGAAQVEKLLGQIQWERREIGVLYGRARDMHADARKLRDRLRNELKAVQAERARILEEAREEAGGVVRELRRHLRELEGDAKGIASKREQNELRSRIDAVQNEADESLGSFPVVRAEAEPDTQPVRPGAIVSVASLGQQGTVLTVSAGEAEVQIGNFKLRLPTDDLVVLSRRQAAPVKNVQFTATRAAPPTEIDVRGWRVDEILSELDQYVHDNYMHGQSVVRIVHGKGTGALRKVIREQLNVHPLVIGYEAEKAESGGDGVTVVKLAT